MSMPVNSQAFDKMVDEDIEWLEKQGVDLTDGCYGSHIKGCLEMAKKYYREVQLPNTPESEWNC
jgi:hypothetical protein